MMPGPFRCATAALTRTLLLVIVAAGTGCSSAGGAQGGSMQSVSLRTESAILPAEYQYAVFTNDRIAGTSIMLSDVPVKQLINGTVRNGQIMHIELLWVPKPGETPMDASATNASIRHIVIADGQVGIYGGAGFAKPSENPYHTDKVSITVRQASLALQESTDGFVDLLSPTSITGTFTARRDDRDAREMYFAVSQLVTNVFGRTRYVQADAETTTPGRAGG